MRLDESRWLQVTRIGTVLCTSHAYLQFAGLRDCPLYAPLSWVLSPGELREEENEATRLDDGPLCIPTMQSVSSTETMWLSDFVPWQSSICHTVATSVPPVWACLSQVLVPARAADARGCRFGFTCARCRMFPPRSVLSIPCPLLALVCNLRWAEQAYIAF